MALYFAPTCAIIRTVEVRLSTSASLPYAAPDSATTMSAVSATGTAGGL